MIQRLAPLLPHYVRNYLAADRLKVDGHGFYHVLNTDRVTSDRSAAPHEPGPTVKHALE